MADGMAQTTHSDAHDNVAGSAATGKAAPSSSPPNAPTKRGAQTRGNANNAKYLAFRAAAAILAAIPARLIYATAPFAGLIFWTLSPRLRARVEANLRHVPGLADDTRALRQAVRGVFYYALLNYIDLLRGARLTPDEVRRLCTTENEAAFDALLAEGRGMVLFMPHTSGWELAGALLAAKGVRVAVPAERVEPPQLFAFLRANRERRGVHILPADSRETLHTLVQVLKEGGVVVFVVDRHVNGASTPIPFFGEPAPMPVTPAALALRLGAPVGVVFPFRLASNRIHLPFIPLVEGTSRAAARGAKAGGEDALTAEALQRRFLEQLEGFLLTHPEQWVSALSPVWPDGT